MDTSLFLECGVWGIAAAALVSAAVPSAFSRYACLLSTAAALLVSLAGLAACFGIPTAVVSARISGMYSLVFQADELSGFFLFVTAGLSAVVSLYAVGYSRGMERQRLLHCLYNLFIVSMIAVLTARNIVTFLVSWEAMSIVSYFLVTFDRSHESARSGLLYAVMTHIGTSFLVLMFLVFAAYTGSSDFQLMRGGAAALPASLRSLLFVCAFIGFGTKAGIIPLHTWLPRAHPAAPSHVSALMSGVMIKTGVYGFLRIVFDVLGGGPDWWGFVVLAAGGVSAITGILYALSDRDLKRVLAYSSVENIGIVFLGIGGAMIFHSYSMSYLMAISLTAALYHVLNHAAFKGLLFLAAGSVVHGTGTKQIDEMGGLIKRMPDTALFFLAGSLSICALPPFNGFVSEWLTYQAMLLGYGSPSVAAKIITPLGGAALAMTGALAAACFVKVFGISFLGNPRSEKASGAHESLLSMKVAMGVLAAICLLLGILPGVVIELLAAPIFRLTGTVDVLSSPLRVVVGGMGGALSPAAVLASMVVTAAAAYFAIRYFGKNRAVVFADSWDCGMKSLTARMQYTAAAFTKPLQVIFKRVYLPRRDVRIDYAVPRLFVRSITYRSEITPFFEHYLYDPVLRFTRVVAERARVIQSGSLHLYLAYILVTLIVLLVFGI